MRRMSIFPQIGPFIVQERIGAGGFGDVYRAEHEDGGISVAIKVVTAEAARQPDYQDEFRREVRAVAGLEHPHVVQVYDYGMIPASAASIGSGLIAGSPYLVMELATGSLADIPIPMPWETCRFVLHDLLSALAHAHAKGLIHRDIKPANALLVEGREGRILRLSDFGIAQTQHENTGPSEEGVAVGTPSYMAPEQFLGNWRALGPWTDLYQTGIMAFQLAMGVCPFEADTFMALAMKHVREPLPASIEPPGYPASFGTWLRRMCAKRPGDRFASAAEAAWALAQIDDGDRPEIDRDGRGRTEFGLLRRRRMDSGAFDATLGGIALTSAMATIRFESSEPRLRSLAAMDAADVGATSSVPWQLAPTTGISGNAASRLGSVGAGLFGLRSIPIVGRSALQQTLWETLHRVRESGQCEAVLLEGGPGVGKSRLAAWLAESADELGLATPVVIRSERSDTSGGLGRALANIYRCSGLQRKELRERIEQLLCEEGVPDPRAHDALAELICEELPGLDITTNTHQRFVRFGSSSERHAVFEQFLRRTAARRPVVLWLDDAHFGGDALSMLLALLRQGTGLPLVAVVTCRDDLLAERSVERALLQEFASTAACRHVAVTPLDEESQHQLVANLLGLSGELAASVRQRAGGNPLFAIQLIGDLIARGDLVGTRSGFALRHGAKVELPADVRALWNVRIERATAQIGPQARTVLQVAALLGVSVDARELRTLSLRVGILDAPASLEALADEGLLERTDGGWRFNHPLLRESLEAEARSMAEWHYWNYACAEVLSSIYEPGSRGLEARRATHLQASRAWSEALNALNAAVREAQFSGETLPVAWLLDRREEVLDALHVSADDPARAEGFLMRAEALRLQWNFGAAGEWADRALAAAERAGSVRLKGEALLSQIHVARQQGDAARAEALCPAALRSFRELDDARGLGKVHLALAIVMRTQGRTTDALGNYERALSEFMETDDAVSVARCRQGMANLHRGLGRHRRALGLYQAALSVFESEGVRNEATNSRIGMAEVARFQGRLAEAEQAYLQALSLQRSMGDRSLSITRCNLALVGLAQGRFDVARAQLELAETESLQAGQKGTLVYVHTLQLPCIAAAGEKALWDRQVPLVRQELAATRTVDKDLAQAAEQAGDLLAERGLPQRAREGWEIALEQFKALEDWKSVSRLESRLTPSSRLS